MKRARIFLLTLLILVTAVCVDGQTITEPESVVVHSDTLQLRALLWHPMGKGSFPAVLFNREHSQSSPKPASAIDLSGTWRDDRDKTWTVSQKGTKITITNADGSTTIRGTLDGRVIKYTDQTILGEASDKACHPYVGQTFDFPSKFKISKDGNKLEREAPESVTKGKCRLNLKNIPVFVLTKAS
jgi:hypothetical protein